MLDFFRPSGAWTVYCDLLRRLKNLLATDYCLLATSSCFRGRESLGARGAAALFATARLEPLGAAARPERQSELGAVERGLHHTRHGEGEALGRQSQHDARRQNQRGYLHHTRHHLRPPSPRREPRSTRADLQNSSLCPAAPLCPI